MESWFLFFIRWAILGQLLTPVPQLPHLQNGDDTISPHRAAVRPEVTGVCKIQQSLAIWGPSWVSALASLSISLFPDSLLTIFSESLCSLQCQCQLCFEPLIVIFLLLGLRQLRLRRSL